MSAASISQAAVATAGASALDVVLDYHERTKHRFERYAAGPETLDWDSQPNPFREFAGAPRVALPVTAAALDVPYGALGVAGAVAAAPLTLDSVAQLLELSLGISAWKQHGPDRWAVRCNPSSGNLHPTEAYVVARGVGGLADGVYHYVSRDHALERRCLPGTEGEAAPPGLWIGLSSIAWREAWKYGERAFRYCQLDVGHALGALRYAAAILGWDARLQAVDAGALASLLGLDRDADFGAAEREDPDLLLRVGAPGGSGPPSGWRPIPDSWAGQANRLDPRPMYRWPVIDAVSRATVGLPTQGDVPARRGWPARPGGRSAVGTVLGRRSAQRFDPTRRMAAADFFRMLASLSPDIALPWDVWARAAVHPVLFVHRVEGLEPGLYALPRPAAAEAALRQEMAAGFLWETVSGAPPGLPLFLLARGDFGRIASRLSCHQAIAGHSCFSLAMLADFSDLGDGRTAPYRHLHWEAGLIGQALYLEAEAAGLRGTGIGCFFDDPVHASLGLRSNRFRSIYHFTVGYPLEDARIATTPAYPGRVHPIPGA